MNTNQTNRRNFLKQSALAAGAVSIGTQAWGLSKEGLDKPVDPKADAIILIWLPGGIAQNDTWDPKSYTPFRQGMKGSDIFSTCGTIPTAADGIFLGEGLDNIAGVMDKGTILRTLVSDTKFGAIHLKAQHYQMTSYEFPAGVQVPSIGSMVARSLGRRHEFVPAYMDIGRDINTSDQEMQFISNYQGPGFLGVKYAPFMIPEPSQGMPTLNAVAGMKMDRLDRRQNYLEAISGMTREELREANKVKDYMSVMEEARAMMDSPVKKAFDLSEESPETIAKYDKGHRFGLGCLLARRLVETGARFIEVEYQYGPFKGFDMHENAQQRMVEMKQQIDSPIGTLIHELDERGLLERTLVVIMTEFGRTIADKPKAGTEEFGFAEDATGHDLIINDISMYGHHGHFSSCSNMLFFGGGFKQGHVHGVTANEHPMAPVEKPEYLIDVFATIYKAMGIPADTFFITEDRPFYVTKDGKGVPIEGLLA